MTASTYSLLFIYWKTIAEVETRLSKFFRKIVTNNAKEFKFGIFADICLQLEIHQ